MKIYITRKDARSIQVGGLGRLDVWFNKPIWHEPKVWKSGSNPFADEWEVGCYSPNGWGVYYGAIQHPISFGTIFGYDSEFPQEVWKILRNHFNNEDFRSWDKYEEENIECDVKYFFLEIDLKLDFNIIKKCI